MIRKTPDIYFFVHLPTGEDYQGFVDRIFPNQDRLSAFLKFRQIYLPFCQPFIWEGDIELSQDGYRLQTGVQSQNPLSVFYSKLVLPRELSDFEIESGNNMVHIALSSMSGQDFCNPVLDLKARVFMKPRRKLRIFGFRQPNFFLQGVERKVEDGKVSLVPIGS